jgi:ABC-2 type transport system permease protein
MLGEYVVFSRGLAALAELRAAGPALTLYFLEGILALVLLVSLVSFVASGLWMFYRARDTRLLLAAPVPLTALYALRAIETFLLTSWAQVVVGVPALAALGVVYERGPGFYARGAVILTLFAVLLGAAGTVLTTAAAAVLRRASTRLAVAAVALVLVAAFALLVGWNLIPSAGDFYVLFEPGVLNGKPASIKFIESRFALWPSHPFAAALYTGATGGAAGTPWSRALVWVAPLAVLALAATLGPYLYVRTLPAIAERFALSGGRPGFARATRFPRRLTGPVGALLERDLLVIGRSPHELGRAAFLGLLLALYTSFVVVAPLREVADRPDALGRLVLLNVMASGYFLTAFALRFVFPALSLEGRAAWVLFSSPVRLTRLVFAKLALATGLLAATVVPIALVGMLRLVRDPALVLTSAAFLLMMVATTATLLLALGAAWPNFREPNPEALSTSAGGLIGTVICLIYVAVVGWGARAAAVGASPVPPLATAAAVSVALMLGALGLLSRRAPALEAP